ncbi:MAG: hypothetical protein ACXVBQ_17015 [Pseudobdellovibrionaceae bacterium]
MKWLRCGLFDISGKVENMKYLRTLTLTGGGASGLGVSGEFYLTAVSAAEIYFFAVQNHLFCFLLFSTC